MPQIYLHFYGNESSKSLLEAYGFVAMDQDQGIDQLKPKHCPNCDEPNKPESKFCARCRMILSYDAYEDTVNNKQEKEDAISMLSDQLMRLMTEIQELKNKTRGADYPIKTSSWYNTKKTVRYDSLTSLIC